MSRGTRPKQGKGANFQDMITFRAITKEGATFCYDMFALRAEKISRGAKLFVSRRLFEWDIICFFLAYVLKNLLSPYGRYEGTSNFWKFENILKNTGRVLWE